MLLSLSKFFEYWKKLNIYSSYNLETMKKRIRLYNFLIDSLVFFNRDDFYDVIKWLCGSGRFEIYYDPIVLPVLFYYGVDYRANRRKNDYQIKSPNQWYSRKTYSFKDLYKSPLSIDTFWFFPLLVYPNWDSWPAIQNRTKTILTRFLKNYRAFLCLPIWM